MDGIPGPTYQPRIIPELHRIQHEHGYLDRAAMEAFSKSSGIPLNRIHAVASFFPHFRTAPPPRVSLRVCRDMACHLAGGGRVIEELAPMAADGRIEITGVSCLGRCDQAPAACMVLHAGAGHDHDGNDDSDDGSSGSDAAAAARHAEVERFLRLRSINGTRRMVEEYASGQGTIPPPSSRREPVVPPRRTDWLIDPYNGEPSDYRAVRKLAADRIASIQRSAELLREQSRFTAEAAEKFTIAATRRGLVKTPLTPAVAEAVRSWQTASGWAEGPGFGEWSEALLRELDDAHADLRGLGGAGIPATQKWRDVRDAVRTARARRSEDDRAFIVVNGDESEPATFKDRELLLRFPHIVIEGVILAGLLTEATEGFIYIRHEYPEQIDACRREIKRAEKLGICGQNATVLGRPFPVSVFVSPGGYICGEQSALIEAMSDRRAEPRNMPPKLETNGLDDRPTLVSNVETFAWVPYIAINGGAAYAALGVNGWKGRRFFSVSGDVKRPGVYEVPMGLTLRELICGDAYCQGVWRKGQPAQLKAIAPSGPSGGFIPAKLTSRSGLPRDHVNNKAWQALAARRGFDPKSNELDVLDLELELNLFRALSPTQALGAGLVVYSEGRDLADQAVNAMEFYRNESCGKCVPCRVGSQKLVALGNNLIGHRIDAPRWNGVLLPAARELGKVMEQTSICGLGRSASLPLRTAVDYFPQDVAKHTAAAESQHTPASLLAESAALPALPADIGGDE
jgi:NADH:ubiquinone oxidoreductase subunit F (NADH-binding)